MNFDELTLSYLSKSLGEDTIEKAVKGKKNLVYVQKPVTRNGRQFMQGFWVAPEEAKADKKKGVDLIETKKIHTDDNGKYSQERAKLHDKIIDKVVSQSAKPKAGEKPVAILMGGGSASGKSTMRDNVIDQYLKDAGVQAGTVDSDEIKKDIPEFDSLIKTNPDDAARLVHEESSDVGAKMIDTLIEDGRHFIYDGTMKNKDKYMKLVNRLKDAGYEVHAYIADIPLEEAIRRSDERAKKSGRKVPHGIIESSHRGVPGSVEAIKDKVDSYKVFDNTETLTLFASNDFINPERYAQFLNKGGIEFRATAERN